MRHDARADRDRRLDRHPTDRDPFEAQGLGDQLAAFDHLVFPRLALLAMGYSMGMGGAPPGRKRR
jgi:hypothetical protein